MQVMLGEVFLKLMRQYLVRYPHPTHTTTTPLASTTSRFSFSNVTMQNEERSAQEELYNITDDIVDQKRRVQDMGMLSLHSYIVKQAVQEPVVAAANIHLLTCVLLDKEAGSIDPTSGNFVLDITASALRAASAHHDLNMCQVLISTACEQSDLIALYPHLESEILRVMAMYCEPEVLISKDSKDDDIDREANDERKLPEGFKSATCPIKRVCIFNQTHHCKYRTCT